MEHIVARVDNLISFSYILVEKRRGNNWNHCIVFFSENPFILDINGNSQTPLELSIEALNYYTDLRVSRAKSSLYTLFSTLGSPFSS